jgi:uncharacterized protein YndB with AHSA1/START domain
MPKTVPMTFTRTIKASAADIYEALTSSTILRQWFCDTALVDASKGGRFYAEWNSGYYMVGNFTATVPGKKLAFTWHGKGEPEQTQAQITLAEKKGQTKVTVTHTGVGSGKAWAKAAKPISIGWERSLESLQSAMETGVDRRISLRPMLGIVFAPFDAGVAKKLGVPVDAGVLVTDIIDGMGAQAAGLQKDDVMVSLGGKKVTGGTLPTALQGRQGGDEVAVKFYRSGKLNTVTMKLSKRPMPDIPASPAELATALEKIHAEVNAELDKAFEGVSEVKASARPSADEWSAKEILCHLLVGEYGTQGFVAEQIDGHVRQYDTFGGNVEAQHAGILAGHPTCQDVLAEFKRARRETVGLFRAIPPKLVENKSTWWTICYQNLQPPLHDLSHVTQIREAIEAAK